MRLGACIGFGSGLGGLGKGCRVGEFGRLRLSGGC